MSRFLKNLTRNFKQSAKINQTKHTEIEVKEMPAPNFNKVKEYQTWFQRDDDGMPSYLKSGMRDKHLFEVTLLFLGVGLVMGFETCLKLVLGRDHLRT